MSECTCNSTHGSADCPFHGWAKAPKESTVLIQTEYRKCGCVYERSGDVLIRRRYCAEHPAEIQNTLSTSPSKAPLREQIEWLVKNPPKQPWGLDEPQQVKNLIEVAQSHTTSELEAFAEKVRETLTKDKINYPAITKDAINRHLDQALEDFKKGRG